LPCGHSRCRLLRIASFFAADEIGEEMERCDGRRSTRAVNRKKSTMPMIMSIRARILGGRRKSANLPGRTAVEVAGDRGGFEDTHPVHGSRTGNLAEGMGAPDARASSARPFRTLSGTCLKLRDALFGEQHLDSAHVGGAVEAPRGVMSDMREFSFMDSRQLD